MGKGSVFNSGSDSSLRTGRAKKQGLDKVSELGYRPPSIKKLKCESCKSKNAVWLDECWVCGDKVCFQCVVSKKKTKGFVFFFCHKHRQYTNKELGNVIDDYIEDSYWCQSKGKYLAKRKGDKNLMDGVKDG